MILLPKQIGHQIDATNKRYVYSTDKRKSLDWVRLLTKNTENIREYIYFCQLGGFCPNVHQTLKMEFYIHSRPYQAALIKPGYYKRNKLRLFL